MTQMNFGKHFKKILTLLIIIPLSSGYAFDPFEDSGLPADRATKYIEGLGFKVGEKNILKDGTILLWEVGTATIKQKPEDPNFINSRRIAYDEALLKAKSNLVNRLGIELSGSIVSDCKEGNFPSPEIIENPNLETAKSILGKGKLLLLSKIDNALEANGLQPTLIKESQLAEEEKIAKLQEAADYAERLLSSSEYQRDIKTISNRLVSGVQTVMVFEDFTPGETNGTISVAAAISEKTLQLAASLSQNNPDLAPNGDPLNTGLSIKQTIQEIGKGLLTKQGVQMYKDEKGNPVLLSFAHSQATSSSTGAKLRAVEKAEVNADQYIIQFMGEMVSASKAIFESQTLDELTRSEEHIDYQGAFESKKGVTFDTGGLAISGITKVIDWAEPHPLTNQEIIGVVKAWSPSSSLMFQEIDEAKNSSANDNSNSSTTVVIEDEYSSESKSSSNIDF
ncbi:MAG: hypothetical protein QNL25_00435 [Pelagibacterales bacterium]